LEIAVPFQHKYGYIKDEKTSRVKVCMWGCVLLKAKTGHIWHILLPVDFIMHKYLHKYFENIKKTRKFLHT